MDILQIMINSVLPLFIVLIIGVIYYRIKPMDFSALNDLGLRLLAPIFIFKKIIDSGNTIIDIQKPLIFMLAFTIIMAIFSNLTANLFKMHENKKTTFVSNAVFMNFGNMGIPLVLFTFGDSASGFAVIMWIVLYIPLSTYALWLTDTDKSIKKAIVNILAIPIFPAFIIAMLFNEFSLTVPEIIAKPMDFLSGATIPVLTLVCAFQLAKITFNPGTIKFISGCVFTRLILSPVAAIFLVKLLGFPYEEALITTVMASTPMASGPIMYALIFKRDVNLMTATMLATTVFSAITIPFVIKAINIFITSY